MSSTRDVIHLQRQPIAGNFSVERLFDDVRTGLRSHGWTVRLRINRFASRGLLRRLYDSLAATRYRGQVVHVLGDVHYLAWLRPRRGTILTILDCVGLEHLRGPRRFLLWLSWYWWPARRVEHITTISSYSKSEVAKQTRVPERRITVIPPSLSPEFMDYIDNAPSLASRPQPPRILQVGSKPTKNVARVIEALRGLDVTLVIVGSIGSLVREELVASGLRFEVKVGLSRQELLLEYLNASVLTFVSLYEGFGMPIIEAQACGCPIVTSGICAMPEAAGEGALVVDPENVFQIRSAVERILSDPPLATSLIEAGFHNARGYSVGEVARRYAALYENTGR